VPVVWVWLGAIHAATLAHAVVCRGRYLSSNEISSIANGAFGGLTALTYLYDVGLRVGLSLLLVAWWCLHGSRANGLFWA
jgi:hypothetical protein